MLVVLSDLLEHEDQEVSYVASDQCGDNNVLCWFRLGPMLMEYCTVLYKCLLSGNKLKQWYNFCVWYCTHATYHTQTHTQGDAHTHIRTHTDAHTHTRAHTHTHARTHTHTRVQHTRTAHTHTHSTHTHTHAQHTQHTTYT